MNTTIKRMNFNKITMAITFAEAGEHDIAEDMLRQAHKKQKQLETKAERRPTIKF